jgi:DNA-binding XRE family transcriptional regulator
MSGVACVYSIRNTITGRCYIGGTRDTTLRWHNHRSRLRRGIHGNAALQADWLHYGETAFAFASIEPCSDVSDLLAAEQRWIAHYAATTQGAYNSQERTWERRHTAHSPDISNGLREMREARMLTQTELAQAVGVSRYQTVARWESGKDYPQPRHLRELCEVLGVTPEELRAALSKPAAAPPEEGQG